MSTVLENSKLNFNDTAIAFASYNKSQLRKAHAIFRILNNRHLVKNGTRFALWALRKRLPITPLIKSTIYQQFCGGANLYRVQKVVDDLKQYGVTVLLDYGVEDKEEDADLDKTTKELLRAIRYAQKQPEIPAISCKISGLSPMGILEKKQQNTPLNQAEQEDWEQLKERLHKLGKAALKSDTALYIDAEESWIQDTLDGLITELMATYNTEKPIIYNTIQLYRHDRLDFLKQSHQEAVEKGYILGAKLVRGAYMDKENKRAEKMNYASPIQPNKAACDADFNKALDYCTNNIKEISFCNASHNEESSLYLTELITEKNLPNNHPHICFAQLYGMSNHISFNLANAGYNVSKYLPYGPVKEVIPYLIRRAEENTAVSGQSSRELQLIKTEMKRRGLRF